MGIQKCKMEKLKRTSGSFLPLFPSAIPVKAPSSFISLGLVSSLTQVKAEPEEVKL